MESKIKANELRIGSKVFNPEKQICSVREISDIGTVIVINTEFWKEDNSFGYSLNELEPIELSEQVLLKCGFEYVDADELLRFSVGACDYVIEKQDDWYFIGVDLGKSITYFIWHIEYLHQFQNICSILGKELEFKA